VLAAVTSNRIILLQDRPLRNNRDTLLRDIDIREIQNVRSRQWRPLFGLATPTVTIRVGVTDGKAISLASLRLDEARYFVDVLTESIGPNSQDAPRQ
jgi:hypothetical protein